jgi:hypothetical protein
MNALKFIYIITICFFLASCTVYTIKQSEILSQSVYHANDSFDKGRFDLTDKSLDEAVRIVRPPEKRIPVDEISQKITSNSTSIRLDVIASDSGKTNHKNQRVLIVPEKFKGMTVVVVNSDEYSQLLKDKEIFLQLQKDYKNLKELQEKVDQQIIKEQKNAEKLVNDNNLMQKKLVEKDFAILKRNIITVILILVIAGGIYLRMKGIL